MRYGAYNMFSRPRLDPTSHGTCAMVRRTCPWPEGHLLLRIEHALLTVEVSHAAWTLESSHAPWTVEVSPVSIALFLLYEDTLRFIDMFCGSWNMFHSFCAIERSRYH